MALGKYPDVPLAIARERQASERRLLAAGIDPMAHRKSARIKEKLAKVSAFATLTRMVKFAENIPGRGELLRRCRNS